MGGYVEDPLYQFDMSVLIYLFVYFYEQIFNALTSTIFNSLSCINYSRSAIWAAYAGFVSLIGRVRSNRTPETLFYTS